MRLPPSFGVRLDPETIRHRDNPLGGTPFSRVPAAPAATRHDHRVGARRARERRRRLARALIALNLAQPVPPRGSRSPRDAAAHHAAATAAVARRVARARRETPVLITAAATAASARRLGDVRLATRLVVAGGLGFTPLVTALALFTKPRLFTLAALTRPSLHTLHAISHGTGVWHGCIRHLTFDPVVPDLSWRMHDTTAGALIELLHSPG